MDSAARGMAPVVRPHLAGQLRAEVAPLADAAERLVSLGVDRQDKRPWSKVIPGLPLEQDEH